MIRNWIAGLSMLLGVATTFGPAMAQPKMISDDLTAWQSARQAEFAQWTAALNGSGAKYGDLIDRSRRLTKTEKQEALGYFKNGFELWQAGDFVSAELGFKRGLEIDPANGMANFYYGECLQRRGDNAGAREYFTRAITLGKGSAEALKAETALRSLPQGGGLVWDCAECPKMTGVPAGEFSMGMPVERQITYVNERPVHSVTLPIAFGVGTYEVTRAEYGLFAAQTSRAWLDPGFAQTPNDPAVMVSWDDAKAYAAWLSQKTGKTYRLLSETEWEYAARAGTTTAFSFGDTISTAQANFNGDSDFGFGSNLKGENRQKTTPVGSFPSNRFGLFDMHGNVFEWTEDCWNETYNGAPSDNRPWTTGDCSKRIVRGGAWNSGAAKLRSANRNWFINGDRDNAIGFRVARTL